MSSLAGADRATLVLAVAKDDDLRSFERRERTAKRASEAKNRDRTRYMGSQDASASCLVSAHDRIMGTHSVARRRCNIILAMLKTQTPYQPPQPQNLPQAA